MVASLRKIGESLTRAITDEPGAAASLIGDDGGLLAANMSGTSQLDISVLC